MNEERYIAIIARLAVIESDISNMKEWKHHQNERLDKTNDKIDTKIDKIIDNERQLLETINDSDSTLDDKIDERFNRLQMWLLGTAATAGLGLLMFILENVLGK